ncbi:MAG TPA: YicC family protein [Clostridiales bacterium]|nr:YicC family protein [Clostridiaceae bacterium]HOQ07976.1 YicC family protein [Clostridiales bacterium]HPV01808.1 YicC family protein [Clostridiales bacterium]
MVRSMTGFGRGEASRDGKEFTVEIKTVNHRYFDIFVKMPRQISFLEERVREFVGKAVSRGKIDIYITYTDYGSDSRQVTIDEPLAQAYLSALEQLRDRFSLADDISVSLLSRCPEVLKVEQVEEDAEQLWEILRTALDGAVASLIRMREIEGEAMKKALLERADAVEDMIAKIEARAPEVPKEYKAKLTERIIELLGQQTVDESRIAMEVALFADRCSIDEELVRLRSHFVQMRQILGMDQPVGRKLDFLVQEMNREINTIGSKANDLEITRYVVDVKSEIEKIREQVQNIE